MLRMNHTYFLLILAMGLFSSQNKKSKGESKLKDKTDMIEIKDFVERYTNNQGMIKGGTLCFYGHWFGRPYDNYHEIISI